MTIFEHPLWPVLLPALYLRRGRLGVNGPRQRIEVRPSAPLAVFGIRIKCAFCDRWIEPVRRDARGAWTFNVSCRLTVDVKCARMPATTAMASRVRAAMEQRPMPHSQPVLF